MQRLLLPPRLVYRGFVPNLSFTVMTVRLNTRRAGQMRFFTSKIPTSLLRGSEFCVLYCVRYFFGHITGLCLFYYACICSKILYRLLQSWILFDIAEKIYFSLWKCRLISFVFRLNWIFNYERVALQAERALSAVTQHCQFIPLFGMSFIHKMGLPLPSSLTLPREMANPKCGVLSLCRAKQSPGDNGIFTPYTTHSPTTKWNIPLQDRYQIFHTHIFLHASY